MRGAASSKSQADDELKELRRERGVENDELRRSVLIESLDGALNILSDQLYQKPTHFILELIQNADDNQYSENITPTLDISLYERNGHQYLRTDCSEVGFTFEQLDALTKVGKSTKLSTSSNQRGYIGEKGIGFKSVFKVAHIVQIASGFYEFKFDRNRPLGMILPITAEFPPSERIPGCTQILLRLHDDVYNNILEDLESIDPQILIFLRRLKILRINTPGKKRVFKLWRNPWADNASFEMTTIQSRDRLGHRSTDKDNGYIVYRDTLDNLPADTRREGITSSEVILAFPVAGGNGDVIGLQSTYAFLPIGLFGFRFLIHADFLLVASRESLEYSAPWNKALRKGVCAMFVRVIEKFAALLPVDELGKYLRYSWPMYLPHQPGYPWFWRDLRVDILERLSEKPILESRKPGARLCEPRKLRYVPSEFRFDDSDLFDSSSIRESHLAFDYDHVRNELKILGVDTLSILDLFNELKEWIAGCEDLEIEAQGREWHRRIAQLFCHRCELGVGLSTVSIIPLHDGSWVNANKRNIYLPSAIEDEHVPAGVDLNLVDQAAAQDRDRRKFYKFLGIKKYAPSQVCDLILKLHARSSEAWRSRASKDLVSDAAYLFKHRSLLDTRGAPDIAFVAKQPGTLRRSRGTIYIIEPSAEPSLVSKYISTPRNPFGVLYEQYETEICGRDDGTRREFYNWLLDSQTVTFRKNPRLVNKHKLTPEWEFLRDASTVDLLTAVKLEWAEEGSGFVVVQALKALEVRCLDGIVRRLNNLAVPTNALKRECPHLDFIDLPVPRSETWRFLSEVGVLVAVNTPARLRELEALRQGSIGQAEPGTVHRLYSSLSAAHHLDRERIRSAFNNVPLVYVAEPHPRWLPHGDCVWTAPDVLHKVTRLSDRYPDCEILFCNTLGVKPPRTSHVVNELCTLSEERSDDIVGRFTELLTLLGDFLRNGDSLDSSEVIKMRSAQAFPVLVVEGSQAEPTIALRSVTSYNWYIPDRATLASAFKGKVNLLDISVRSIRSLTVVFEALDLESRYLSAVVRKTVEIRGSIIRDVAGQDDLRARVKYLACLAAAGRDTGYSSPDSAINVWSVPSITLVMKLNNVMVEQDDQLVTFQEDDTSALGVYICEGLASDQSSVVTFELEQFLSDYLEIPSQHRTLALHILGEPLGRIAGILETRNIFLPDERGSGSISIDMVVGSNFTQPMVQSVNEYDSQDTRVPTPDSGDGDCSEESDATDSDGEGLVTSSPVSDRTTHPRTLIELVQGYQTRVESVRRRAADYQLSSSLVARAPEQHGSREDLGATWSPSVETVVSVRSRENGLPRNRPQTPSSRAVLSRGEIPNRSETGDSAYNYPPSSPSLTPISSPRRYGVQAQTVQDVRLREIGSLGEAFVYDVFKRKIGDWTFQNWTSKIRFDNGFPRFQALERDYLDFTYRDLSGQMSVALGEAGVPIDTTWSNSTTFHLEVKTTLGDCSDVFFISQNQVDKLRAYDSDPENAFVLLRVFHVDDENRGIKFFPNPWRLYLSRVLNFRSTEGYRVIARE